MLALMHRGHGLDLVRVEARDALRLQGLHERLGQGRTQLGVTRRAGRDEAFVDNLALVSRLSLEFLEKRADIHAERLPQYRLGSGRRPPAAVAPGRRPCP